MNAAAYKHLINQKGILDHTTLNFTVKELVSRQEHAMATEIKRILDNNKIAKPDLHSKGYDKATAYYQVDIPADTIEKITDIFSALEAASMTEHGETTATATFYATLADKWHSVT